MAFTRSHDLSAPLRRQKKRGGCVMRTIIFAALAAVVVSFIPSAPASAWQPCGYDPCYRPSYHRPARRVIGHRWVRRPVYAPVPRVHAPLVPMPAPAPQCQGGCNEDLLAVYVGCVVRNGVTLWQYRTRRGVYNMTVQQRSPGDLIRMTPDGRVLGWVPTGRPMP